MVHKDTAVDYATLGRAIEGFSAAAVSRLGLGKLERIAVYLPKVLAAVVAMFGAARAGCTFVPVNPLLKPAQVGHILRDCNVRALVTSGERAEALAGELRSCADLRHLILASDDEPAPASHFAAHRWHDLMADPGKLNPHRVIDTDMVSIFYTSGSTGRPKGVILSHRNMVTGAKSVASYLGNHADDRLLAVLPFIPAKQRPTHPNDWMTSDCVIASTDPACGARFKITRLGKRALHHSDFSVVPLGQTNG